MSREHGKRDWGAGDTKIPQTLACIEPDKMTA